MRSLEGVSNGRRMQIARARLHQWTPRVEDRFLQALGATCNAKAAYTEAGMSKGSAYTHRERWPRFARRWQAAEAIDSKRLEFALARHAAQPVLVARPAAGDAGAADERRRRAEPPPRPSSPSRIGSGLAGRPERDLSFCAQKGKGRGGQGGDGLSGVASLTAASLCAT